MNNKLNVAVVHYHLRTGGVRRVIDNALLSLADSPVHAAVLTGEGAGGRAAPPLDGDVATAIVPELQYRREPDGDLSEKLAANLMEAARRLFGKPPDLWHFHNHSLGKNPALPAAVSMIAGQGFPVLLQIHDFAEDGRPELYRDLLAGPGRGAAERLGRELYPAAGHVHYALINRRDAGFMETAGASKENLHFLPNPVSFGARDRTEADPPRTGPSNLVLYPTRGIRRKNVGEVLLWAAVAGDTLRFGLTRGPENPEQKDVYDRWVGFSERLELPVRFEMGRTAGIAFEDLFASAHSILTTSVAEGFGLCFLEPFLAGKALCGRRLPEITADFGSKGIDLSNLYDRLLVPLGPIGTDVLRSRIQARIEDFYRNYKRRVGPGTVDRVMRSFVEGDMVDFGRLDEPLQEKIITHMKETPRDRTAMEPGRLILPPGKAIDNNRKKIEEEYSLAKYGRSLGSLYDEVACSDTTRVVGALSEQRLLDCFLAPERFSLLRT